MTLFQLGHLRNLRKHSLFTLINVLGLSLCLAVALAIFSFVRFQFSYDDYHSNGKDIFRVTWEYSDPSGYHIHWARVPIDFVNDLPKRYASVKGLARLQSFRPRSIKVGEQVFREEFAYAADAKILDYFKFELIKGEATLAPNRVLLTSTLAAKYFGDVDPIGEEIIDVRDDGERVRYTVEGVIGDQPTNTHLPLTMITAINSEEERTGWAFVYVELAEAADAEEVAASFEPLVAENDQPTDFASFHLQPIQEIHLHSKLARELKTNGDYDTTMLFLGLGILLVIVATINFTNLNGAQTMARATVFGMKKVLGASRKQLVMDFFVESTIICVLALVLALGTLMLTHDHLDTFFGVVVPFEMAFLVAIGFAMVLVIALTASLSPMRKFTRSSSIDDLRNKTLATGGNSVKKGLLVFQFSVALSLLSGMLIFQDQLAHLTSREKGYDSDQVLVMEALPSSLSVNWDLLHERINGLPGVVATSGVMQLPSSTIRDRARVLVKGIHDEAEEENAPFADTQIIETNYDDFLDVKLVAGRGFEDFDHHLESVPEGLSFEQVMEHVSKQRRKYLINETAVKTLGIQSPEAAIGKQLRVTNGFFDFDYGEIVGVMQDYHQESFKEIIDPMVFIYEPIWLRDLLVKTETTDHQQVMTAIREIWMEIAPDYPLEFAFMDEEFQKQFSAEQQQLSLIRIFSGLAIFIAVMGVFGLIAFALQRRKREVAIRRVLGANVKSLLRLFLQEYLVLMLVGLAFSVPAVWWIASEWLASFAYRTSIGYVNFLIALGALTLLLGIVISHRIRNTSNQNPAQVLKVE